MRRALGFAGLVLLFTVGGAVGDPLSGSKHDLTSLNERAGVEAMTGLAFNDYRDPCVYCHVPDSVDATDLEVGGRGVGVSDWNRFLSDGEYELYDSESLASKPSGLGAESLLCLSCHDGSMAVDMVLNKPAGWNSEDEAALHMRMDSGGGMDKCTQCHDGTTAHRMDSVLIGMDLKNDHPVGMAYPGAFENPDFFRPSAERGFANGVRLFNDKVECASCHNVHDPGIVPFLRVEQGKLCYTCHNK